MNDEDKTRLIAAQNDTFRANFYMPHFGLRRVPGQFVCTQGVAALAPEAQLAIWHAVAQFSDFSEGNDPHGEHDFGAVTVPLAPERVFWKIDYYADKSCREGSDEPSDPARCFRVLTIMLASEYCAMTSKEQPTAWAGFIETLLRRCAAAPPQGSARRIVEITDENEINAVAFIPLDALAARFNH